MNKYDFDQEFETFLRSTLYARQRKLTHAQRTAFSILVGEGSVATEHLISAIKLCDLWLNEKPKMYGFYSQKMFNHCGGCVYQTPRGVPIFVTVVNKSQTDSGCSWDDMVPLGEVTNWVSSVGKNDGRIF